MVAMSTLCSCNFGTEIISSSKKEQRVGYTTRNKRLNISSTSGAINTVLTTSKGLQFNNHTKRSSWVKSNVTNITIGGLRNIDHQKPRKLDISHEDLIRGELCKDGLVYQHNFLIKSYELDLDNKATMVSIINQLQESAINHFKSCGLVKTGFGSTPEMAKRGLIWVIHKLQVVVDHYPSWNDIVQLSTWACACGKNNFRRDWIIHDSKTGEVLIRAICLYAMMNKETRKLSKVNEEIMAEITPYFLDCDPIIKEDNTILRKLNVHSKDCKDSYLVTKPSDLDINQHVSHVSYIDWILESAPRSLVKNHWLSAITLKYRKECGTDSELRSLSMPIKNDDNSDESKEEDINLHHSLLVDGLELVRARTVWKPKPTSI